MMATRQIVPIVIALISVMLSACVDAGEKKERPTGPAFPVDGKAMAEVIEHARNELMQSSSVTVRADNLRLDVQLKAVADLPFAGSDDRSVRHDGFWGDLQPGGIRLYATERIALFYALDELQ
ncbi:MAG: hypothetical protein KJP03_02490, partial [Gammaproteobacteria bacterium]|nr:hypothetical protein [Gammaproteobacteria bacterium]